MQLKELVRETRGLGPGGLAAGTSAFLLEEGRLRHDTRKVDLASTRRVEARASTTEEEQLTQDLSHRRVYRVPGRKEAREVKIGRGPVCDVRIDLSSVSMLHAVVVTDGKGGFAIRDASSTNGTFLEGAALGQDPPVPLASGAVLRFGPEVRLTFLPAEAMDNLLRQLDPLLRKAATSEGKGAALPAYLDEDDAPSPAEPRATPAAQEPPLVLLCSPFPPIPLVVGVPITVGRVAGNDLILPHPQVSRVHARFERGEEGLFVIDLASANGTWLGRERIAKRASLAPGAAVGIGPYSIRVVAR